MARKSRKNKPDVIDKEQKNKLKTVMYLRLSVEDDNIESSSIDTQRKLIENYIFNKSEFVLVGEFVDDGKSGTNFNRKGFLEMIEEVKKGKIDCIIVKDLSRFGRNMIDTGHYIEKILPFYSVRFIAINDDFDTANIENNSLLLPLKNIINETYARDVSFKVRKEVWLAMERGECICSVAPFGYRRVRINNKNRFIIDEETAEVVRKIYEFVLKGLTLSEIRDRLKEENVPTPIAFKKKQGVLKSDKELGELWNIPTIKRILTNETYIGNLVQGRRSYSYGKEIKMPREKWFIIEDNHEGIIDKEIFFKVQEIIKNKRGK